jgi:hypothetical protein
VALFAVGKYASYPFKVDENMTALESAVRELVAMENDVLLVQERIKKNHDFPASTVAEWLDKVKRVKNEVEVISMKYKQRRRYIHIITSDYNISRKATKKLSDLKSLSDNQIIKDLIRHAQAAAAAAASQQLPGVEFNYTTKTGKNFGIFYRSEVKTGTTKE